MLKTKIKHIFFDLDHTLWDFDKNSGLSFKQIFEEKNIHLNLEAFLKIYEPINFSYWKLYREEKITKEKLRYRRLKDTFEALNYEISDELIDQISEDYIEYLPNNNFLIEGTLEILNYLKPSYKLHIITNGFERVQQVKLEKSNINSFFDVVVTSDSVGVKKPNAKVFEYALKEAGANKENSLMIGDSYEADVLGAQALDITPIYYNEKNVPVESDVKSINSLLELKKIL
ncbi:YjjG family noncanonical pyrimidine nucleotidase [Tenacibaculum sp. M341]|uniref:YjjG family noncanonical pyrimidine nucleotidase n=1 Tax=Tenacibaculum sp. M341 TaxID=2530339 RepID=UPI001A9F059D|nr:YjjG family noncanonical pyrimidine nucleotidase [Tenacibaculum sp. M341]